MSDAGTRTENKIKNPKGTLTLNEAMDILKDKSNISKMGLRIASVRDGFKSKNTGTGREKYLLNETKFKKWIEDTIDIIPENFLLISSAAKKLNVTVSYVYILAKENNIEVKIMGAGKGKKYINFTALQKVFDKKKGKDIK